MTPANLKEYLNNLVKNQLEISTMIWGAPGIGKSSIVAQVALQNKIDFIDLRLSQLAPTDLRGLPIAVAGKTKKEGTSTWYPPDFLPTTGKGILFLDEINMAPPAMQGVAQQLILDRKVGAYQVPKGWLIWAAGNRKEDRASVFDMPAPLANRFLHLMVEVDFNSFKTYALNGSFPESIIAFLSYRPQLLHQPDPQHPAWPSPRSWEMASHLYKAKMSLEPAIGKGAAAEFQAYVNLYETLPDLTPILNGQGDQIPFPQEPSTRYATTIGLTVRASDSTQAYNAFTWLSQKANTEWVQLFATDLFAQMRSKGQLAALSKLIKQDNNLQKFLKDFRDLMGVI
jgi:hypothetical protein